jgi:simple sugar transport system permease protein
MDVSAKTKEPMPAKPAARRLASLGRNFGLQIGIVVVGLIIWLLFLIGAPATFSSPLIYQAFMASTPLFAIMAIPLTLLIISAEIDLSFPSIMAFSVTLFSILYINTGSVLLAFVVCMLAGLFAGF